jgi:hypothetical protein
VNNKENKMAYLNSLPNELLLEILPKQRDMPNCMRFYEIRLSTGGDTPNAWTLPWKPLLRLLKLATNTQGGAANATLKIWQNR